MSSWLVSLRWIGGRIVWAGRVLNIHRLRAPCFRNRIFKVAPGWLPAEAQSQISEQCRSLAIGQDRGKSRHDRAALTFDRLHPREHDIGEIARIGCADRGAEAEMDPAIGQRTTAVM